MLKVREIRKIYAVEPISIKKKKIQNRSVDCWDFWSLYFHEVSHEVKKYTHCSFSKKNIKLNKKILSNIINKTTNIYNWIFLFLFISLFSFILAKLVFNYWRRPQSIFSFSAFFTRLSSLFFAAISLRLCCFMLFFPSISFCFSAIYFSSSKSDFVVNFFCTAPNGGGEGEGETGADLNLSNVFKGCFFYPSTSWILHGILF